MDCSEEVLRLQRELEERDNFLAIVLHELRNPMHNLAMQLAAARLEAQRAGASAAAERIQSAQKTLRSYVGHATLLLDLAQTSQQGLMPQPGDFSELLRRVAEECRTQAQHHAMTLQLSLPERFPAEFDAVAIEHIISNLLLNACKHSGGTQVLLSLRAHDQWLRISVQDDGKGIPPEDRERIFGKFQRGSRAIPRGGTGLGLWIAQLLAERHGGSISLHNDVKGGSVFTLQIPLLPTGAAPA